MVSARAKLSAAVGVVLALTLAIPSNGQKVALTDVEKSDIVIVGTVLKAGAVSFKGIPASPNTVVVHVDSVVEKPKAVVLNAGDNITLVSRDVSPFRPGIHGMFYTAGWIYGDGIAVREITRELPDDPSDPPDPAQKKEEAMQARKAVSDSELRAQIQSADLVVVGTVKDARPATMPSATPESTPVTEHDPQWQEATIHADSVIKGSSTSKDFVVHFAGSIDVAWYNSPKLKPGQEGVFLLKQDTVSGAPTVMLQNKKVQAYTALNPEDVLSKEDAQRVRSLATK